MANAKFGRVITAMIEPIPMMIPSIVRADLNLWFQIP